MGPNPTDRAKGGTKRSLLTEADGVPIGVAVAGANRHDKMLVEETLRSIPVRRPRPTKDETQGVCMDKGYDYEDTRALVEEFGYTAHIRARCEEAQMLKRNARTRARRWVVERTHSWLTRVLTFKVGTSLPLPSFGATVRWAGETGAVVGGLAYGETKVVLWAADSIRDSNQ